MLERLFSLAGMVVLPCWVLLAAAPQWRWSQRLATFVAPLLMACLYGWLLVAHAAPKGGGFQTLAQVGMLFRSPYALLAGWVHYLALDLFTGAWEAREAARLGVSRWLVLPCLVLTFLLGPLGLALFLLVKVALRRSLGAGLETEVAA
jgi:hypothetical protein